MESMATSILAPHEGVRDAAQPMPAAADDIRLLVPAEDVADPEVTILVPALNEEITIGRFVEWCRQGIAASGARVEILIVDSSTDRTAEIAQAGGARVLKVPRRGLGRAYIDAIRRNRRHLGLDRANVLFHRELLKSNPARTQRCRRLAAACRFPGRVPSQ